MLTKAVAVPADDHAGNIEAPLPATEAATRAVALKTASVARYEPLIARSRSHSDFKRVFTNLRRAPRDNQPPAFHAATDGKYVSGIGPGRRS